MLTEMIRFLGYVVFMNYSARNLSGTTGLLSTTLDGCPTVFVGGVPTGKFVFTSPDFFEMPTQNKYDNLQECLVVMSMDGILKTSAMQKLLTASSNGGPTCFLGFIPSHTIHGNGIFTYIWLIFYGFHVGKYTVHPMGFFLGSMGHAKFYKQKVCPKTLLQGFR